MENPLVGVVGLGCSGLVGKFIFLYLKGGPGREPGKLRPREYSHWMQREKAI